MEYFPGFVSLETFQKIQKKFKDRNIGTENFEGRIVFMSMFHDTDWTKKGNSERCISNSEQVKNTRKDAHEDIEQSSALETKRNCSELSGYTPEGKWDFTATHMVERFKETGHQVLKSIGSLCRGILKRKIYRDIIHFSADVANTELLFCTIHLANQLSIYGAVPSWCEEFGQRPNEKEPTS